MASTDCSSSPALHGGFGGFGFVSTMIDGKLANIPLENQELTCFTSLLNFMLKMGEENKC